MRFFHVVKFGLAAALAVVAALAAEAASAQVG